MNCITMGVHVDHLVKLIETDGVQSGTLTGTLTAGTTARPTGSQGTMTNNNIYKDFLRSEQVSGSLVRTCGEDDQELQDAVVAFTNAHGLVQERIRVHIANKKVLYRMQKVWMEMDESLSRLRSSMNQFRTLCSACPNEETTAQDDIGNFKDVESIMSSSMNLLSNRINRQMNKVKASEEALSCMVPLINLLGNPSNAESIQYHEMYNV